jgi:hypothetical protein
MTGKPLRLTDRLKGKLSLTCSIILFAAVLFFSVRGIRNLSREYRAVLNLDLSADTGGYLGYDDNLYGSIRYGIKIGHRESEKALRVLDFAESSLHATDRRIITCTLIYTMLISAAAAYWLYVESAGNRRKHLWSIFFAVLAVPAGLLAAALIAHAALGLPFFFSAAGELPVLLGSFLAVLGGNCFLGWMLSLIRFKRIAALAAVPAVILLFMQGTVSESGLYCPPEIPSFSYIAEEIEPRVYDKDFEGQVNYDEEKDVIVLNGAEYPPRQVQNPDRLRGTERLAALLFEIISPYAGNGLFLIHEAENINVRARTLSLYAAKVLILAAILLLLKKKRQYNKVADRDGSAVRKN